MLVLEEIKLFYEKNPDKWTQFCSARNSLGKSCPAKSGWAVKWCIEGICEKLLFDEKQYQCLSEAASSFQEEMIGRDHIYPSDVNDWLGFYKTMEMLDRAINIYKEKYGSERKTA